MTTKVKITNEMPADSGAHSVVVTWGSGGENTLKPGESVDVSVSDGSPITVKEGPKTHSGPSTHT